jgi:peroxiredoxin
VLHEIRLLGADLVAISPQTAEKSSELVDRRGFGFEVLPDSGNDLAAGFGLRHALPDDLREVYREFGIDLPAHNGDDSWTLPLPARYLIDREGFVRYARVHADYTVRPEPDETLQHLRWLTGSSEPVAMF